MEENKVATGTEAPAGTAAAPAAPPPQIVSSTVPPPPAPTAPPPGDVNLTMPPADAPSTATAAPPPAAPPPPPAPPAAAATPPAAPPPAAPATGLSAPPPGFDYVGYITKMAFSGQLMLGGGLLGVIGTIINGTAYGVVTMIIFLALFLTGPAGAWFLYQPTPNPMQKLMIWAVGQAAAVLVGIVLFPVLLAIAAGALSAVFSLGFIMAIASVGAMALGAFLKAKEEKMI